MGKRAWSPDSEEDASKLTLAELNRRIAKSHYDFTHLDNAGLRKSAFKRLVLLEELRENLHGVPAPHRTMRSRQ